MSSAEGSTNAIVWKRCSQTGTFCVCVCSYIKALLTALSLFATIYGVSATAQAVKQISDKDVISWANDTLDNRKVILWKYDYWGEPE